MVTKACFFGFNGTLNPHVTACDLNCLRLTRRFLVEVRRIVSLIGLNRIKSGIVICRTLREETNSAGKKAAMRNVFIKSGSFMDDAFNYCILRIRMPGVSVPLVLNLEFHPSIL